MIRFHLDRVARDRAGLVRMGDPLGQGPAGLSDLRFASVMLNSIQRRERGWMLNRVQHD